MEISLVSSAVSVAASQGLVFFAGGLQISASIFPVDTVAPPLVKSNYLKAAPRRLVRKTRRTRRRSLTSGGAEDGEDGGLFGDDGDGDGPFGGGRSGGGGGGGWNFDRFGWSNRDESSSAWPSDPAFDFVYEGHLDAARDASRLSDLKPHLFAERSHSHVDLDLNHALELNPSNEARPRLLTVAVVLI
ncbi:hypothetical protein F0562_000654 [Nyssa sinensis]|uniref:Uncharacterized protein n=1 Tax=Nyssa sinensis TaxID=561372 RepID=A0A5J5C4B9_9ASTE|nr:hypothetical protein F0562_000654 [Nyssa sinensis]